MVSLPPSVSARASRGAGISAAEDSGLTLLVGVVVMDGAGMIRDDSEVSGWNWFLLSLGGV